MHFLAAAYLFVFASWTRERLCRIFLDGKISSSINTFKILMP